MIRYALKSLRANLSRLVATVLAVLIGITFLSSGLMLTDAMRSGLTADVEQQYSQVDLAVRPEAGMEDVGIQTALAPELLETVRGTEGVAAAAGELEGSATVLRPDGSTANLRSRGRAWIDDEQLNPLDLVEGSAPETADEVVLDVALADEADASVGDEVRLETPAGPRTATLVGLSRFGDQDAVDDGGTISVAPSAAAELFGDDGWSYILVRTDGPTAPVADALRAELPATASVSTRAQLIEDETAFAAAFLTILRPVLQGFAYLSMFVCAFVIFNTFSVVVTQRFRELALVRAVGGTPAQVRRSLLVEGLVIGLVASAAGLVVGALLTIGIQAVLDSFDLGLPTGSLQVTFGTVAVCMAVGTVVTVLSVLVPAFRAGRTKPVEAMRDSAVDTSGTSVLRAVVGAVLLALSITLLLVNRFVGAQWYYLAPGGVLLFASLFVAGPLLARLFSKLVMPVMSGIGLTGRLAADNSVRNPRRTATTANALVIGLFLVTLVTVSGEAMKSYVVSEVNQFSSSDFVLFAERSLDPELLDEVREVDDVTGLAGVRAGATTFDGGGSPVLINTTDLGELGDVAGMTVIDGSLDAVVDGEGIAVPDMGELGGGSSNPYLTLGDQITLLDATGEPRTLTVEAVLDDGGLDSILLGYLVGEQTFTELVGEQPVSYAFVRVTPGSADAVGRDLEQVIEGYTGVEVAPGNFFGEIIGTVFDFLIGAVNALLGMSVIVALVGIVNTMTLSIFERRRELGMIRALGMTRRQVGRTIRFEAVLIGLLGTVVGIGAGILLSWVVVSSIDDGAIALSFNWARVGLIFAVGVAVGVLASILPARRATKLDMLKAMQSG